MEWCWNCRVWRWKIKTCWLWIVSLPCCHLVNGYSKHTPVWMKTSGSNLSQCTRVAVYTYLLCLISGSASLGGAFEGQLCQNAVRRLAQSKCGLVLPVFGGCTAILRGLTYRKILCAPEKGQKMVTSRGVNRHKWWRKGRTSGDTTRKCSKG